MLPVNEMAPIRAPTKIVTPTTGGTGNPARAKRRYSRLETIAAAPPPDPLKSATICGIAVIATRRAATAPIKPPRMIPAKIVP